MDVGKPDADSSSDVAQELHVLAVDDSLVDRKVIERLLKISCCKVTAVESGRRALQYLGLDEEKSTAGFDDLKVNLIMTDYSMPEMTGFELLQKIKGSARLKEIPVVIMSSENILARIDRCLEEGAKDYLLKPVRLSDVKRVRDCILKGEHKNSKNHILNGETRDGPLLPPPALQPPPTPPPPPPQPPTTSNCDAPMGLISVPVNCESLMSPIPGPGLPPEPHHGLLVKCPSLVVASD